MENKLYESGMSNKELNNPFSKNLANTNMSSFNENLFNNPLLKQTKKSVKELIDYNTEFQDAKQSTGERIDQNNVDKILSPIYEKLNEIKKKMTTINNDILYNYNENKPNTIDEIFSAHQYLEINKNNLDDTLVYMKETIAKVHYEQIGKDIDELILFLETLYNEIDIMENNYYKKFNTIIREKKRQNYENDILNGKNDRIDVTKYLNKKNQSNIDYNEYKNDLDDIMFEKDDLMLRYANDREEAKRNLPKLMKPSDKTYFSYDIPELNKKEKDEKENKDNLSINNNKNNIQPNKENKEGISNEKSKKISEDINKIINEIEDDEEKDKKLNKPKMTPVEKMIKYQQNMLDLSSQIQTQNSRQTKQRKIIHIGKSKQNSKKTKQPRSLNSKRTLQDFKRQKIKPIYEYEEEKKIPNDLKKKGTFTNITNIEINIPEGMNEDEFNRECEKNIEIYIRNALRETRPSEDKYNIQFESINKEIVTADDFIKLLIQKFEGLNNELKNRKNNFNQSNRNINDMIADKIINEFNEIDVNIDRSNEFNKSNSIHNKKEKIIKISERRRREIEKEKEEGKKIKVDDSKRIPLFESTDKISIEELDKIIQMPHKINLSEYNVSNSSSYLSESLNQRNLNQMLEYHEKNIYSQKEESDNSISRGQAISDENDDSKSFNKGQYDYNIRNRTGLDLLMLKNFNERIPEQILKDKINDNENSENSNSFFNDNNEMVDIDNKERLKKLDLYKSEEYKQFKNFMNQYNNNNQ